METARIRRRPAPGLVATVLATLVISLMLLAAPQAGAAQSVAAAAPSTQPVVLAQDDGLTLVGSFAALGGKPANLRRRLPTAEGRRHSAVTAPLGTSLDAAPEAGRR